MIKSIIKFVKKITEMNFLGNNDVESKVDYYIIYTFIIYIR